MSAVSNALLCLSGRTPDDIPKAQPIGEMKIESDGAPDEAPAIRVFIPLNEATLEKVWQQCSAGGSNRLAAKFHSPAFTIEGGGDHTAWNAERNPVAPLTEFEITSWATQPTDERQKGRDSAIEAQLSALERRVIAETEGTIRSARTEVMKRLEPIQQAIRDLRGEIEGLERGVSDSTLKRELLSMEARLQVYLDGRVSQLRRTFFLTCPP